MTWKLSALQFVNFEQTPETQEILKAHIKKNHMKKILLGTETETFIALSTNELFFLTWKQLSHNFDLMLLIL